MTSDAKPKVPAWLAKKKKEKEEAKKRKEEEEAQAQANQESSVSALDKALAKKREEKREEEEQAEANNEGAAAGAYANAVLFLVRLTVMVWRPVRNGPKLGGGVNQDRNTTTKNKLKKKKQTQQTNWERILQQESDGLAKYGLKIKIIEADGAYFTHFLFCDCVFDTTVLPSSL